MALFDSLKGGISGGVGKIASNVKDLLDPANARRAISGLFPGGSVGQGKQSARIGFQQSGGSPVDPADDWRVRISLSPSNKIFYNDINNDLLTPLSTTDGVVFPYTPSISVTHQAIYNPAQLTHSNYAAQFYQGSEVSDITINGDFTVQNVDEGRYLLAAIYFFRSATKMFFGYDSAGQPSGNPPPIVYLDGYGEHYFPHVPCVITNFTHVLPNEVDYIEIPFTTQKVVDVESSLPTDSNRSVQLSAEEQQYVPSLLKSNNPSRKQQGFQITTKLTRLPTNSSVSITLRPVYSRKSLHEKFNLHDFSAGKLIKGNGGFL